MTDVGSFVWAGLAGGGLSAVLLSIVAVLGKSQLAHWLNKDIEAIKAQHQLALAGKRAEYERELENYRAGLIGAAEAVKANQEVRKAVALLVAQKEFDAINALYTATMGLATLAYSVWRSVENDVPNLDLPLLSKRMEELIPAMHQATFFFNRPGQRSALQAYSAMIHDLHRECLDLDRGTGGETGREIEQRVVRADHRLDELIREVLTRMKAMDPTANSSRPT